MRAISFRRYSHCEQGVAAVEFALIAPILIFLVMAIFAASTLMATMNGLEQIAAGAARSTIAGLSDTERATLAQNYVSNNSGMYPYINASSLTITTSGNAAAKSFTVSVAYDLSTNQILQLVRSMASITPRTLTRNAVVQQGGT